MKRLELLVIIFVLLFFVTFCDDEKPQIEKQIIKNEVQKNDNPIIEPLSDTIQESTPFYVSEYFEEIIYHNEFNKNYQPKKWNKNMKVFVKGDNQNELVGELRNVVFDLNNLLTQIHIEIVDSESESNFVIYLCEKEKFNELVEDAKYYTKNSNGTFVIYCDGDEITNGVMYVDVKNVKSIQGKKHILREELTQSLGFTNDSYKYPNSIFYKPYSETTEFSELDKQIIKMYYS
jgi:hypothetical protein